MQTQLYVGYIKGILTRQKQSQKVCSLHVLPGNVIVALCMW